MCTRVLAFSGFAAVWLLTMHFAAAQDFMQGPGYQRMRRGAGDWRQRGDGHGYGGSHPRRYGGNYDPYFYGYGGPVIQGSWYQRPYPYHFDYYRYRWGSEPAGEYGPGAPAPADCPCAYDTSPAEAPIYEAPQNAAPPDGTTYSAPTPQN